MDTFENALMRLGRVFDDFNFDAALNAITKKSNEFYNGFSDIMDGIKDTVSNFKVVLPFDERHETFKYEIVDGTLTVRVDGKNGFRETRASVPDNCKLHEMHHVIDGKKKELVVIIPKSIKDDQNIKDVKKAVTDSFNETVNWFKDALKSKKEAAESVARSTSQPTSNKGRKGSKKPQPVKKVVRDSKGRFVSSKN